MQYEVFLRKYFAENFIFLSLHTNSEKAHDFRGVSERVLSKIVLYNIDPVAQLVEQYTFNVWVLGSSPNGITSSLANAGLCCFCYMAYVYIIFSAKLNKFYVGACSNLERRLYEHNIGHSAFTCTGIPWELKYKEVHQSLPEAKKREMEIKKRKSRTYIEKLISER
jgi:putative endonuclease